MYSYIAIGRDYIEPGVPYVPIRLFCGLSGLLVVPVAYMTIRGSGHSVAAALLAAFFVCYGELTNICREAAQSTSTNVCILYIENGLIANNRLILLDPPLLFFTSVTILMWVNFHNQKNR